ncbi:lipoprotein [Klebsiella pneumoniae]|nr:lipoprotein [Klebsiella pneumoniae]
MVHFTRFFLNTILGMGGLIDVAGMANPQLQRVEPHRFGSTLGHYGVGYGPYVQLPFYGSFTCATKAAIWPMACIRCSPG